MALDSNYYPGGDPFDITKGPLDPTRMDRGVGDIEKYIRDFDRLNPKIKIERNSKMEERYKLALEIIANMSQQDPSVDLLQVAVSIANIALGPVKMSEINVDNVKTK